ncbi:MAG: chromosome segregation protein ScpA [Candidatus Methanomethylophilus sp.]|nr:chromosome segregation protein ScpA [Methanomethylophilus sp.]MDD4669018.1 chromosome segregation protein ScpA [Methanomethylophilus sp.]
MDTEAMNTESLEQHLLFQKALAEDAQTLGRVNGYLDILRHAAAGERLADPVDESIRAVFSLVLEKGLDPWAIDLEEFVRLYSAKVADGRFDMIVAGRLLLMAWEILNLQSAATCRAADPPAPEVIDEDFDFADEDPMVVPDVAFTRAYARDEARPVTVMDLLDAFEDARQEAETARARAAAGAKLKAKEPRVFDNKAHDEDDEQAVERVWQRIRAGGAGPQRLTVFYDDSLKDDITVFVAVLHLVRDGRLDVSQETLPYGDIIITVRSDVPTPAAA